MFLIQENQEKVEVGQGEPAVRLLLVYRKPIFNRKATEGNAGADRIGVSFSRREEEIKETFFTDMERKAEEDSRQKGKKKKTRLTE